MIFLYPEEQANTELGKIAANWHETKFQICQIKEHDSFLIVKSIK